MYFDYLKERENTDSLIKDYGFVAYRINGDECYLADFYIKPEFRNTHSAGDLLKEIIEVALSKNCKMITATIHLNDKGCNRTLKAAYKFDFFMVSAQNNVIVIAKKLGE